MEKLTKNSPFLKELKSLIKKNDPNYVIIEDLNSLEIALNFNHELEYFIYTDNIDYHPDTKRIINNSLSLAKKSYSMNKNVFDMLALKDNAIGFVALINIKTDDISKLKDKEFLVVCDRLELPGNLGTIYRTMDSANCDGMILVDPITKFYNPKLVLAARGTNLIIPTVSLTFEEALKYLIDNNYNIYLGEPKLGKTYQEYDYNGKIAIVVGNERFGINPLWYNQEED